MGDILYNPHDEASKKGISVKFMNFAKINSLLTRSIIYLRDSMTQIEKRCTLTYELVHHSRDHFSDNGICLGHSAEEEDIIRKETARKLVPTSRLYELMESCMTYEDIAEELKVTKEVLNDYFKYCKSRTIEGCSKA